MSGAAAVYGARGRIGIVDLSTCTSLAAECALALPDDVIALFSRIRLPRGEVSAAALDEMLASSRLEEAAEEVADAGVAVIAFACTTASLLHGPGYDALLRHRIEQRTGVRATTTATAVVEALRALGARTVGIGTPYDDDLNERERAFLAAAGFDVVAIEGLDLRRDEQIGGLTAAEVTSLARSVARAPADVLFLSCTNLPALHLVDALERELGRPVVTSNSATIWAALHALSAPPPLAGLGLLLGGVAPPRA